MVEPLHPPSTTNTTKILFLNILPRLPAKSILRFKIICKQWHSHLTTPSFAKIHLHHLTINHHQNHHKLLVVPLSKPLKFCTIDCETPKDPLTPTRLVPFKASYKSMSIVTSFHGMLCVGIINRSPEYSNLILWNPLTGDYKTLSKPPDSSHHKECYKKNKSPFALYYTSSDNDYKLLRVTNYHAAYIYSLKSDSWRKAVEGEANDRFADNWFSYTWEQTVLLNEKLYFLKQTLDGYGYSVPNSYSILMFDIKTEKLRVIAAPCFGNQLTTCSGFMVLTDRIHLCVTIQVENKPSILNEKIELWRMDEDGDWMKVLNYLPISLSLWNKYPIHMMRNGNWLMYSVYPGLKWGGVVQLDVATHNTELVSPKIYIPRRGKYMETIVSPNQYTCPSIDLHQLTLST